MTRRGLFGMLAALMAKSKPIKRSAQEFEKFEKTVNEKLKGTLGRRWKDTKD